MLNMGDDESNYKLWLFLGVHLAPMFDCTDSSVDW